MTEKLEEKTLKDVLMVIFSHFKVFSIGAAVFVTVALAASHYIPVKYTSTAMFERRSDSVADTLKNSPNESFQTMRLTMQQELASPAAVEKAIDELGVVKEFPRGADGKLTPQALAEKQNLIRTVLANITIDWKVRSEEVDLIAISCNSNNPNLAEQIPNLIIKQYITYASEKILERLRASREFLSKQVAECNLRLAELKTKKLDFETQYGDLLYDGTVDLKDRIQELESDLETRRLQRNIARQKVDQVQTLIRSNRIKSLNDQMRQLKNELDVCLSLNEMTEEHPKVKSLKNRIALLTQKIQENQKGELVLSEEGKDGVDGNLALQLVSAESEFRIITDDQDRLQKRLTTYKAVMTQSVPLREEYLKITKPLEDQQALTRRWQARLVDVEMTISTEVGNRRTQLTKVQTANRPIKPTFPPLWAVVVVAVGGGLVFGYGLSFLAGTMDHTFRKPQEAAELFGIPVVGATSEIGPRRRVKRTVLNLVVILLIMGTLGLSTHHVMKQLGSSDGSIDWKVAVVNYRGLP